MSVFGVLVVVLWLEEEVEQLIGLDCFECLGDQFCLESFCLCWREDEVYVQFVVGFSDPLQFYMVIIEESLRLPSVHLKIK